MSSAEFGWAWDQRLSPERKLVLLVLAENSYEGIARTSLSHIADVAGVSLEDLAGILTWLRENRFIGPTGTSDIPGAGESQIQMLIPNQASRSSGAKAEDTRPGFVYVIADGHGYCKIGITQDVKNRMSSLQTSTSRRLQLIESFSVKRSEMRGIEEAAHHHFSSRRRVGEWFKIDGTEAVSFIRDEISKVMA